MRKGRKGFSLIELLIVVAIIAALVGVAVPFFQDNLQQAQQTKAKEDMDTIRNAISIHDAQNRPLTGTSLKPLLGRYLQEVPKDPWGNDYLLDAAVGIVISFGADGMAGGLGGDTDLYTRYKASLRIQRAQYESPSWGRPGSRTRLILTMTKPFSLQDSAVLLSSIQLLRGAEATATSTPYLANPIDFAALNVAIPGPPALAAQSWDLLETTDTEAIKGRILVKNRVDIPTTSLTQMFYATMGINFTTTVDTHGTYSSLGVSIPTSFGIGERATQYGPMDSANFGPETVNYFMPPEPIDFVDNHNRGVKLEKL